VKEECSKTHNLTDMCSNVCKLTSVKFVRNLFETRQNIHEPEPLSKNLCSDFETLGPDELISSIIDL
jgi:hypothetical protein